jgi:hypothetical protein
LRNIWESAQTIKTKKKKQIRTIPLDRTSFVGPVTVTLNLAETEKKEGV